MDNQRLKDSLHKCTLKLLNMWGPEQRQRSMHHFMEGLPLVTGTLFSKNGGACLVGSGYKSDDRWDDVLKKIHKESTLYEIMYTFDDTARAIGTEETRQVVILAMKEWLATHKPEQIEERELVPA